jgi:cation:H+ antiporter
MDIVLLIIGFALLIYGAERFVEYAVCFSKRLKVPSILIGLTVVAFGTSMPEFSVSYISVLEGANEIAVANVIGSNIFNLAAILGICALVTPISINKSCTKRDLPISLIGALLLVIFGFINNKLNIYSAGILFICFILIMYRQIKDSLREAKNIIQKESAPCKYSMLIIILGIILGLGGIILGGKFVVDSAISIATKSGISERIIGLTIASIGTSLPELVTSVIATIKKQNDIAVGNVIGSNIFNIFFILGFTGIIHPMDLSKGSIQDAIFLSILSMLFFIPALRGKLGRLLGGVFLILYIGYICFYL